MKALPVTSDTGRQNHIWEREKRFEKVLLFADRRN